MATSLSANEVKTPLRFHLSEKLLNANKRTCKDSCPYYLIGPNTYLMDFMIIREASTGDPATLFNVVALDGSETISLEPLSIYVVPFGSNDYLIYNGLFEVNPGEWIPNPGSELNEALTCGKAYRIEVSDGTNTWFSEPFLPVPVSYDGEVDGILNGGFATDLSDWTTRGPSWVWNGGKAEKSYAAGSEYLVQTINNAAFHNRWVRVEFTLSGCNFNTIGSSINLVVDGQSFNFKTEGTHYVTVSVFSFYDIYFDPSNKFTGFIDNVKLFAATNELECHLKLEWESDCFIGNMLSYSGYGITNRYWFPDDANAVDPEYKLIEEGKEDGEKNFVPTFQKRVKTLTLETGLIPEYVLDALFDMQMHKTILLYYKYGIGYDVAEDIKVRYKWEFDEGCFATSTIEVDIADRATSYGCCNDIDPACLTICTAAENIIANIGEPQEGSIYVEDGNQFPFTFYGSGNISMLECGLTSQSRLVTIPTVSPEGGADTIFDAYYFYDGASWIPAIQINITSVDATKQQNTASFKFQFSLTLGSVASGMQSFDIQYSTDGINWNGLIDNPYTKQQMIDGVELDFGTHDFYVRVYAQRLGCGVLMQSPIYRRRLTQAYAYSTAIAFNWNYFDAYVGGGGAIAPPISNANPQDIVDYLNSNYGSYEYKFKDVGGGVYVLIGHGLNSAGKIQSDYLGGSSYKFQLYDHMEIFFQYT